MKLKSAMFTRPLQRISFLCLVVILFAEVGTVFAHTGQPITPHDFWGAWNNNFYLLLAIEIDLIVYLWGIWQLWHRAGLGHGVPVWRCLSFVGALITLVIALISPLDALSGALFSAHMLQHLILIFGTAPLLLFSDFSVVMLWALPRRWAHTLGHKWNQVNLLNKVWQFMKGPLIAWFLFGAIFWIWHTPAFYQAALQNEMLHAFEHLCFLFSAMLFWRVLFNISNYSNYGLALPYLFSTALHSGILGALMTFSTRAWYQVYATSAAAWGLTAIQDQQLAGVIMWIPSGAVLGGLSIFYFALWLRGMERQFKRNQRQSTFQQMISDEPLR
jgi:putative membrane protein